MSTSFIQELDSLTSVKRTENDAVSYSTSSNKVLDLFALGGAYRTRSSDDILRLFAKAFNEDKALAVKALFYLRDIRGGQGERKFFRYATHWLFPHLTSGQRTVYCDLVEHYGRLDDLLIVYHYKEVKEWIKARLREDLVKLETNEPVSLLGKWLPSINTSSQLSVRQAQQIAGDLGWTEKQYRQSLAALRKRIHIVERDMSANKWSDINYEAVPSQAMLKYRKAFSRKDADRFVEYLGKVKKGEAKIHAGTLYPYQIVAKVLSGWYSWGDKIGGEELEALEVLWNNLPNYVPGNEKAIVVADVSGSMWLEPMCVALSLGLYFAERNVGPFANNFITFSAKPKLQTIPTVGNLKDRLMSMITDDWMENTDIDAVFNLLLDVAKSGNVAAEDMPSTVYIVSDMEFDRCTINSDLTNFKAAKKKWADAGYELPVLVFWNVQARQDTLPVRAGTAGTILVSGCSPSIFQQAIECTTPLQFMLQVLLGERYKAVDRLGDFAL